MDVPKQQTIAMDPAARLHPRKHRQFLLSRFHSPQLRKEVARKLPGLHKSLGICTMLLTVTYRMPLDQLLMKSLLFQLMYQPRLKRHPICQDLKSMSLPLQLPRHLERWVLTVNRT